MNPDSSSNPQSGRVNPASGGPSPLSHAVRQRLQRVFDHGQRCVEKQDHDYANKLLTQCVVEDPGNLIYLQAFIANLQKKHGDNRKGSRLAGIKIKSQRSSLVKAAGKGDWTVALGAGCAALALNPWDIPTLLALAHAYEQLGSDECELFCLRLALSIDAKHIGVNRQSGLSLQRLGQFDQAIACWRRVQLALPEDEQARQSIAQLSVEQTIHKGGYDPALLSSNQEEKPIANASIALLSQGAEPIDDQPPEIRLQAAIAADPTVAENYLRLADIYLHEQRFDDTERLLTQGSNACGSGNLEFRARLEDVQLRRVAHQLALAEQQAQQDSSQQAQELVHRFRVQANQLELETYAARAERDPTNLDLKIELGLRLKRAGKIKEAISALQSSRTSTSRAPLVLVELGECFQHIEQYKLALSHYEEAIGANDDTDAEIYRKALYRAGVLATGMQEYDRAERHLTTLAALDYAYRDVADRLDKMAGLRDSG